jgi:hypothetical protein
MIFSSIYFFVVNHCLNKFNLIYLLLLLLFFNYIIKLTKLVNQVKSITQILFFFKKNTSIRVFFFMLEKNYPKKNKNKSLEH